MTKCDNPISMECFGKHRLSLDRSRLRSIRPVLPSLTTSCSLGVPLANGDLIDADHLLFFVGIGEAPARRSWKAPISSLAAPPSDLGTQGREEDLCQVFQITNGSEGKGEEAAW